MIRLPALPLGALLVGSTLASGCSIILLKAPPETLIDPRQPVTSCSTAPLEPIIDAAIVAVSAVGVAEKSSSSMSSNDRASLAMRTIAVLAVYGGSSAYGFWTGSRCRDLQHLGQRCRQGDGASCHVLDPDFEPGRPRTVPLLCARDAHCAAGQRCLESACVETSNPDTPGEAAPSERGGP
jgi:hypothetical protein